MKEDIDEWGSDPAVRAMRKISRAMDDAQREFFGSMEINMYDHRIRPWRESKMLSDRACIKNILKEVL